MPNNFILLLKTGLMPVSTLMGRLLEISSAAISQSVWRGEKIVSDNRYAIVDGSIFKNKVPSQSFPYAFILESWRW
jgi:hypothetical protein